MLWVLRFLSTLSLRRATNGHETTLYRVVISIHALLAESDPGKVKVVEPGFVFLSTLSLRRATINCGPDYIKRNISIHALLAESDVVKKAITFNPPVFLSTLSLRRATPGGPRPPAPPRHFYPRSPCGERPTVDSCSCCSSNFYPRSPCGERPRKSQSSGAGIRISIHALLAESDYP